MKQGFAFVFALAAALGGSPARATDTCPGNPDALGTSRTLKIDTSKGFETGEQFGRALPLEDKEIVLTFDDGPILPYSEKVRAALKAECVQATYFLVGRNAASHPEFVRQLAADGHTIGTHTWSHDMRMPEEPFTTGLSQINRGIAAVNMALKTSAEQSKAAPFFRFPGLNSTKELRNVLKERGIGAFDINAEGGDWIKDMTSDDVLKRAMGQIRRERRGIVLLHDIQPRTAAMLPAFLRQLKKEGYKVVHLVPEWPEEKDQQDNLTVASLPETAEPVLRPSASSDDVIDNDRQRVVPVRAITKKRSPARHDQDMAATKASDRPEKPYAERYASRFLPAIEDRSKDDIDNIYRERRKMFSQDASGRVNPSQAYAPQGKQQRYADIRQPAAARPQSKYLLNALFDGLRGAN